MRLFSGADVHADYVHRPDSGICVIAFSYMNNRGGPGAPFGRRLLEDLPVSRIEIVATRNHWWQTPEIEELSAAVAGIPGYDRLEKVGYGASMGAYGALLMARDLKLSRILAASPQTVINDPDVPLRADWTRWLEQERILRDDVAARLPGETPVWLMYDPWHAIDRCHVAYLVGAGKRIVPLLTPFVGHPPFTFLKEAGLLGAVTRELLLGTLDAASFRRQVRAARHRSANYHLFAGSFALRRGYHRMAVQLEAEAIRLLGQRQAAMPTPPDVERQAGIPGKPLSEAARNRMERMAARAEATRLRELRIVNKAHTILEKAKRVHERAERIRALRSAPLSPG